MHELLEEERKKSATEDDCTPCTANGNQKRNEGEWRDIANKRNTSRRPQSISRCRADTESLRHVYAVIEEQRKYATRFVLMDEYAQCERCGANLLPDAVLCIDSGGIAPSHTDHFAKRQCAHVRERYTLHELRRHDRI